MKKFFKGLLVFLLIVIIVGGLGFIGYSFLESNYLRGTIADQQMPMTMDQTNTEVKAQDIVQQDTSMSSHQTNTQQNSVVTNQLNVILKNKDYLDQARAGLKDALKYMTLDPYAPVDANQNQMDMGNMQPSGMDMGNMQSSGMESSTLTPDANQSETVITVDQGTSTITITPPTTVDSLEQPSMTMDSSMQSMGTVYDAAKMEQLHGGLFKLSVGMELLKQLSNEFQKQAEFATVSTQNPIQDYTNQYNLTSKNQTNLRQAMGYIEEAANLVNINPYISPNGLVYDKDRMGQIHQSLVKLAEGVALINLLNSELSYQSIYLANTIQLYVNNAHAIDAANASKVADGAVISGSDASTSTLHTTNSPLTMTTGIFGSINMSSVVNIILVVFVVGLILGILGFVFSLFKAPQTKTEKN